MGPLEQKLGEFAMVRGWRLRWKSEPPAAARSLICTELDIFKGRTLVTASGPFWLIHGRDVASRERIANMVLEYPSRRRGAQAA